MPLRRHTRRPERRCGQRYALTTFHATTMGASTMRDVVEIVRRCTTCQSATRVLVVDDDLGDDGEPRRLEYVDQVPHDADDCARLLQLRREEWPPLVRRSPSDV